MRCSMELNERQQIIMELLREKGQIRVTDMAKELHYSEMTIRRDLAKMEAGGLLRRSHGVALENDIKGMPLTSRSFNQDTEKRALCREGAKLLEDGMSVFLDSSSTCLYMIPYIAKFREMSIFTNSVQVLLSASGYNVPCYITGGKYYEKDMCLLGYYAENFAADLNVDIAFFSCAGYSDDGRITDYSEEQSAVRRSVMKGAKKSVMLLDSSKKNLVFTFTVCREEELYKVITV